MRPGSYLKGLCVISLAVLLVSSCSSFFAVNERAMTVEDIINMTKAEVGADIITRQIEVTRSRFKLDPDQIIRLKKAGVDDKVLEAMIETEETPAHFDWEYGYSPNEYWFSYYNQWYPVYHYYPYGYPSYGNLSYGNLSAYPLGAGYSPYAYPYSVFRRSGLLGRFYRYVPIYPPRWDYGLQRWTKPGEQDSLLKEEEKY